VTASASGKVLPEEARLYELKIKIVQAKLFETQFYVV
jgi:hypothetical protein